MDGPSKVYLREVQRFGQPWIWGLLALIVAGAWYSAFRQLFLNKPVGTHPAPDSLMAVIWGVFGIGFPLFFWILRLITEVREDGLYVRFIPFHRRFIKISGTDIICAEVYTFRPLRDYGSWGIRCGPRGKAYTVKGDQGVELELRDGRRLMIGSQRAQALAETLSSRFCPGSPG
jgi:hypothetical protein